MAWSKTKSAVVAGTIILLATVTTVTVTNHSRPTPPAQTGKMNLPTGNVTPMIGYGYSRYGIFLASDGSVWSWGEERFGWPVLGLEKTNIQNSTSLRRIGHDADWASIAVGSSHCLAIKSDGTLWGWGGNYNHQLGDGTEITRPTPVRSIPGNDWKQAAAGGSDNSYALKNDGTLWAWGRNNLGTNVIQIGTATNWAKVWAGSTQTVGLQSDGSLWFWGSFTGDGKDNKAWAVPTRISPDTNWVDVCFGYFTVLAIKADGTLWSWGREANYYTESSDTRSNTVPMRVGQETDWQSCVSTPGCLYHLLKKKDGSFWALDASEHRMVKPAADYHPIKLRKIELPKDVVAFAAGDDNIGVMLTRDGEVWTWGKVIGEFSRSDHVRLRSEHHEPTYKTVDHPWQLSRTDD